MKQFNTLFRSQLYFFCTSKMNPYKILGLEPNASMQEIRNAYIELSKRYHPDVNQNEGAGEQFKQIHEAYNYLKSVKFEEKLQEEFRQQYYASQTEEELFRQIFGFYFYEQPLEYYKPENQSKREEYQELLKKYKTNPTSQQKQNVDLKINRIYKANDIYEVYREQQTQKIKYVMFFSILFLGFMANYLLFVWKPQDNQKRVLDDETLFKLRQKAMLRYQFSDSHRKDD